MLGASDRAVHLKDLRSLERNRLRLRRVQLAMGLRLARIQQKGSFLFDGAASFGEFAEKRGFCAGEARILASAALVAVEVPAMRQGLLEGTVCPEKLACVGRVLQDPSLVRPDDDWGRIVRDQTVPEIRSLVRKREAESRHGVAFPLKGWLSPRGADAWLDCRQITIRKARRPLTEGETMEEVFVDYARRHGALERAKRALERGAVAEEGAAVAKGKPGQERKAMPAAERHALVLRNGDCCAIEKCDNRSFLQNAHRIPHRAGGPATAANGDRLCTGHHGAVDSATLRIALRDGRRVLVDRDGGVVARFRTSLPPP